MELGAGGACVSKHARSHAQRSLTSHAQLLSTCCELHALNLLQALVRKLPLALHHHLVERLEVVRRHNLPTTTHLTPFLMRNRPSVAPCAHAPTCWNTKAFLPPLEISCWQASENLLAPRMQTVKIPRGSRTPLASRMSGASAQGDAGRMMQRTGLTLLATRRFQTRSPRATRRPSPQTVRAVSAARAAPPASREQRHHLTREVARCSQQRRTATHSRALDTHLFPVKHRAVLVDEVHHRLCVLGTLHKLPRADQR